jgi:hypothetical protein
MSEVTQIQEQHTAGPQAIGFDYQFLYFMSLALELKTGEKVGFEVRDDIYIERANGKTTLFQSKHTVLTNADGIPINLTTLDIDLWKTLSNWVDMIKADTSILTNNCFCLVTNKGEGNNQFIEALNLFKADDNLDSVIEKTKELRDKTENRELKAYIKNVLSLGKKQTKSFLSNLSIETDIDDIIGKIKTKIFERTSDNSIVDTIFDSLFSNMSIAKYLDIKYRKQFEISFQDFCNKFGKCFKIAWEKKPLPKRNFTINLPDNLEDQTFIKQLLDIGEIAKNSPKVIDYTTHMLQVRNHLSDWTAHNLVLPTEMEEFQRESILKWNNEFRSKYRQIERQINSGIAIESLETEIQNLAVELVDFMRREDLYVADDTLGIELSNGHYYSLSDKPEIGWHFDWEKRYKTT